MVDDHATLRNELTRAVKETPLELTSTMRGGENRIANPEAIADACLAVMAKRLGVTVEETSFMEMPARDICPSGTELTYWIPTTKA